jgi:glycosyltransferase involved in cell wall biosynthesis
MLARLGGIQFFSPDTQAATVVRYRTGHLHEQLCLQNVQALMTHVDEPGSLSIEGDVLVFSRLSYRGRAAQIAEVARANGKALVYSVDDLLFEAEFARQSTYQKDFRQTGEDVSQYSGTDFWRWCDNLAHDHHQMLMFCDCAIVSTEYLAERIRRYGKPVYVIRNSMSQEMARLSQGVDRDRSQTGGRVTLGYLSGSATHTQDLGDIAPMLARVMEKHWNVYLIVVGPIHLPAILEKFGPRIRRHPFVKWQALPGLISDIDINLAPLDMLSPFNHAKSEIKWMEAGAVGVPTVASKTAGFCEAIRHGETGLLANTPDEWEKALEDLIEQPELRERIGAAARQDVYARYTAAARSAETVTAFAEITERFARPTVGPAPMIPPWRENELTGLDRLKGSVKLGAIRMVRNWSQVASPYFWGRLLHQWDPKNRNSEGKE